MKGELQKYVKGKLQPLKDLELDDIYRFGNFSVVRDISIFDFENTDIPDYNNKIIAHVSRIVYIRDKKIIP